MTTKSKQNLGKKEIVDRIKFDIGLPSKRLEALIDDIIDALIKTLCNEKKVNIKNFGSFNVTYKKERKGRNPKNMEEHVILSRNTIKFKASNQLKKKVNEI